MIILIYSLIIALIAIYLVLSHESSTNQAKELIPVEIPVDEVVFSQKRINLR